MINLPTDLEICECIFRTYYRVYKEYQSDTRTRVSKIFVPIDIDLISRLLHTEPDLIFGRLYYAMNAKHENLFVNSVSGEKFDDNKGTLVNSKDNHVVNFPLIASILSELREADESKSLMMNLSIWSLVISAVSIVVSAITAVMVAR